MKADILAGLEAVIFAAEGPVSLEDLSTAVDLPVEETEKYINNLREEYDKERHGFYLREYDHNYQFLTKPSYYQLIKEMYGKKVTRLSQAALETLAIIAYKQPITRGEIEDIRGVKAEKTLLTLSKYGLIEELGRKDTIGNPIVYGTSKKFLQHFDLNNLSCLPELDEQEQI